MSLGSFVDGCWAQLVKSTRRLLSVDGALSASVLDLLSFSGVLGSFVLKLLQLVVVQLFFLFNFVEQVGLHTKLVVL